MKRARGFSLIELMIAMVILSIVMTGAVKFFRAVNVSVANTVDRMDAMQNLRFGLSSLDREVRSAGAGTVEVQPTLIYIDSSVVAFNVDLVSRVANSPTAVYYNPDADPQADEGIQRSERFTIPTTSYAYPDSTYRTTGGELSPAETVVYYFTVDTSTTRTDDFMLMKQVNGLPPDVVTRNLLAYPGKPFFEWLRTDAAGNLQTVAAGSLPQKHSVALHGSLGDTVPFAAIDSIRAVRVWLYSTNGQTGTREVKRALVTTIRIPNAGLTKQRSCGDPPFFGRTVSASFTGSAAVPKVTVTWSPGIDETSGEKDVERYAIYRRPDAGSFEDALQSIPGGQPTYTFDDTGVLNDSSYVYGVSAIDCTPLESTLASSGRVNIPSAPVP
jgi:prepilin-type N-terminal cleavage/methylation domain-containing protein